MSSNFGQRTSEMVDDKALAELANSFLVLESECLELLSRRLRVANKLSEHMEMLGVRVLNCGNGMAILRGEDDLGEDFLIVEDAKDIAGLLGGGE